jgi:DNA replication and checkpoint protein
VKPLAKTEKSHIKTEYVSAAKALKQVTPRKSIRDSNVITPIKGVQQNDDTETVGPTPQVNGRMLGLFDGIQEQTPASKRRLNWGERLAEARKESPKKSTPGRKVPSNVFHPEYAADAFPI